MSYQIQNFELSIPQAKVMMCLANQTWCPMARGTGKTTGIIAPWILHKVDAMPRASGGFVGTSFEDLDTRILKAVFTSFSLFGLEEGEDYVYGKRPPADWDKPYIPIPKRYDNVISFPNGTTMELISLAKMASANALNLQWLVGDEVKFFDQQKFQQEVLPILGRGNLDKQAIGKSPWYGSLLMVTDKLSPNIHWVLKKKELHNEKHVNIVIQYQIELNKLRIDLSDSTGARRTDLVNRISRIEKVLAFMRYDLTQYVEAKSSDNPNLTENFFTTMKNNMTDYEYRIQIENEDPNKVENGFYAAREEKHLYDEGHDEDYMQPLGVALDYQASISPLVSFQINDMVEPGRFTLNILSSDYVLQPYGLKHVIDRFCEQRKSRPNKTVFYYYDHTAVGKRNMHSTMADEVAEYFKMNGWRVVMMYMGQAPLQSLKYNKINLWLENEHIVKYPIRINKRKNVSLILSMDQTGTKEGENGTQKDKSKERDQNFPQEQATHFSDTFDMIAWGVNELKLIPRNQTLADRTVMR